MKKTNRKLDYQIDKNLRQKLRIGESRHQAKKNDADYIPFKKSITTIHSISTLENYIQVSKEFADWCVNEKQVHKYTELNELKPLAVDYLKYREDEGMKLSTIKRDRAGLGKLFGEQIDYKPTADSTISRSRHEVVRDMNFNPKNHEDLCNIALGTGLRRHEISELRREQFSEENGRLYLNTVGKGGRFRKIMVSPQYSDKIGEFIKLKRPDDLLFTHVNSNADIHSMRREYAIEMYKQVVQDEDLRNELSDIYPPRERFETVKSEFYSTRSGKHFQGRRDDIYLISQLLGHNRLNDTIKHYLT